MRIYHGSKYLVAEPTLEQGRPRNDFGQGFYCTDNIDLAREWACDGVNAFGYANIYELDTEPLSIFDFRNLPEQQRTLVWAATLMANRRVNLTAGISKADVERFIDTYAIDCSAYDVIIGYRADDSYFDIMRAFCHSAISLASLEQALLLGDLGIQIVLTRQPSFDALRFVGAEEVDARYWGKLRNDRNREATGRFLSLVQDTNANPQHAKQEITFLDIARNLAAQAASASESPNQQSTR